MLLCRGFLLKPGTSQVLGSELQIRPSLEEKVGFISHPPGFIGNGEGTLSGLLCRRKNFFFHLQEQNLQPCSHTPPQPVLPCHPLRVPYVTCHRNISLIFLIYIKSSAWLSWECSGVCGMRNISRFYVHALTWRSEVEVNSRFCQSPVAACT